MGINNIHTYITNYIKNNNDQPIIEDNNRIYGYRSLIIDLSNRILTLFRCRSWKINEYKDMIKYIKSNLKLFIDNISNDYDEIILFSDIRRFNASIHEILFSDHMLKYFDKTSYKTKKFKLRSTIFLPNDIPPSIQNIVEYGKCEFEIKNIYMNLISEYSNINYLTNDKELLYFAYSYGILRSLLYHGKHSTLNKDNWQLMINSKNHNLIPPIAIYVLYHNILEFTKTYKNIKIILSNFEADFSIFHYLEVYPNTRRIINSNDSDFLLANDSNVLLFINRHLINTKKFWYSIFGEYLDTKIIKIIAVLLGTSHNPYSDDSPIHIKSVDSLLKIFDVDKYSKITFNMLINYINDKCNDNPDSIYCFETLIALNVYIHNYENSINEYDSKNFTTYSDDEIQKILKDLNTSVYDILT